MSNDMSLEFQSYTSKFLNPSPCYIDFFFFSSATKPPTE